MLLIKSTAFAQEESFDAELEPQTETSGEGFSLDEEVLQAITEPLREYREGRIAPAVYTQVAIRIEGIVKEVLVGENSKVKRGDILLEMDCSIERAELEEARLAHRLEKLKHEELKAQKADVQSLQAITLSIELKLARLNSIRETVKYCQVAAPHDGRIAKVLVKKHQAVPALTNAIAMFDEAPPEFHFSIPQDWLGEVAVEREFEFQVGEEKYRSRLFRVATEPDEDSNDFAVVAKLIDKKPIVLGSRARVYRDDLIKTTTQTKPEDAKP